MLTRRWKWKPPQSGEYSNPELENLVPEEHQATEEHQEGPFKSTVKGICDQSPEEALSSSTPRATAPLRIPLRRLPSGPDIWDKSCERADIPQGEVVGDLSRDGNHRVGPLKLILPEENQVELGPTHGLMSYYEDLIMRVGKTAQRLSEPATPESLRSSLAPFKSQG
jgi:hypothetical protein